VSHDLGKWVPETFRADDPRYRFHLWLRIENADGRPGYHVFWRRLAAVAAALLLAAWLALAGAAWLFLHHHRGFAGLSYLDLALPHRWDEHRRALGLAHLARAREQLADGHAPEAAVSFAAGLARVPEDLVARRELALIQLRFGNAPAALATLAAQLEEARADVPYLRLATSLMFELGEDAAVADLARRLLPAAPDDSLPHQFLALQLARVSHRAGDFDTAGRILAAWDLGRSVEGLLLAAAGDWERGDPAAAFARVARGRERFPTRDEIPLQLVVWHLELGQTEQARREALVRIAMDPVSPGPRLDLLSTLQALREDEAFARELERYRRDFAQDPEAQNALAWTAASLGRPELAADAVAAMAALGADHAGARLARLAALVESGTAADARQLANELQREFPVASRFGARVVGWRALAHLLAGDPDTGLLCLRSYLGAGRLAGPEPLVIARHLERLGRRDLERELLVAVLDRSRQHQGALLRLVRLDTQARNVAGLLEYAPRLLATDRPTWSALQEVAPLLDPETPDGAALAEAIRQGLARGTGDR
jgi:hypothetical protein